MAVTHGGDIFSIARENGWDWREVLDMSASINPLGPSPRVRDAIVGSLDRIHHYPEQEPAQLRNALGKLWNVDPAAILLGNGATDLIHFLAHQHPFTAPTLIVPTFTEFHRVYPDAPQASWPDPAMWPPDGCLVITNPNNPTGEFQHIDRAQPLLLDESFIDFTDFPSAIGRVRQDWVVLRSLTKFYALPGLRIGALVSDPARVQAWRKGRPPWQVNVLAEAATVAAISDREHAERSRAFVRAERTWLQAQLAAVPGVHPRPSVANFMLVDLDCAAEVLCRHLLARRILVRHISPNAIRIAVRTRAENQRFLAALQEFPCASAA